jgi:hypothetical protein
LSHAQPLFALVIFWDGVSLYAQTNLDPYSPV